MNTRIEYLSLELQDFRQFRGRQTFEFARPSVAGHSALTVVTGGGASGKTNLLLAMKLALWGARQVGSVVPSSFHMLTSGDVFAQPHWYVNCDALDGPPSAVMAGCRRRARVRLSMRVAPSCGAPSTMQVSRSWHVGDDSTVTERLRVETSSAGQTTRLVGRMAQTALSAAMPLGLLSFSFSSDESMQGLSELSCCDPGAREGTKRGLEALVGELPDEALRAVAPLIIRFANRLLLSGHTTDDVWLVPESAIDRWPDARPLVPGVWVTRPPSCPAHIVSIGRALGVGLSQAGETRAPLVIDSPTSRLDLPSATCLLEELSRSGCAQVVLAVHSGEIDRVTAAHWEREHRIYLVENPRTNNCSLLSDPVTVVGSDG